VSATALAPASTILIAGIGNLFLGDDAFGSRVIGRLATAALPAHVQVEDFGIRGLDLAYALLEPRSLSILVDATRRGGAPGTLYVVELEPDGPPVFDTHAIDPANVLRLVAALGGQPGRIVLIGCEPASIDGDELSPTVAAAIDPACDLIWKLIESAHA
jgi:hydrogenase maturation protease